MRLQFCASTCEHEILLVTLKTIAPLKTYCYIFGRLRHLEGCVCILIIMLWRCHIAPAKPTRPIPFDLNDKRCNLTGQIVFSICHRAHTDLYRVYTGSCPAWYQTLHPHTVLACLSHRVITVSSPCAYRFLSNM